MPEGWQGLGDGERQAAIDALQAEVLAYRASTLQQSPQLPWTKFTHSRGMAAQFEGLADGGAGEGDGEALLESGSEKGGRGRRTAPLADDGAPVFAALQVLRRRKLGYTGAIP